MPKFYDIPELFMVVRFYEDTQRISIRRYSRRLYIHVNTHSDLGRS